MATITSRRWYWAIDVVIIVLFAAVGRDSHGFGQDFSETVRIAAPFLIAYAISVLAVRAWRTPQRFSTGLVVSVATLGVGMLLRRFVFDDGTAVSFVLVTAGWLVGLMVAWRLVASGASRWRRATPESS